ncbi:unnamed protein product [Linum trigynum]|uniref:Uncharacterized protein n=1 Tax=Linum trigynum TaxID=586398 RepID=A0AAV2GQF1_9ROSI
MSSLCLTTSIAMDKAGQMEYEKGVLVTAAVVGTGVASAVYSSNLGLLEAEMNNTNDMLVTMSVLELFDELPEVEHGT